MKLSSQVLSFLKDLKRNNNRDWFNANKDRYLFAKSEFENFVAIVISGLAKFEPELKYLAPKDCVFRIYRDTRFSKSGDPYKINMGAAITKGGRNSHFASYYFHVEPGNSFVGGGIYMPLPENLAKIRNEIIHLNDELETILKKASFKKTFGGLEPIEVLKKSPKGFPSDAPEIIRNKHFIASQAIDEKQLASDLFSDSIVKVFKELQPLNTFLNQTLE